MEPLITCEDETNHLTREEKERIDRFLNLFANVEAELQKRLGVPDTTQFNRLLRDYRQKNVYWHEDADAHYAQIRNFLAHERTPEFGYPVAVTRLSVECLGSILQRLKTPRRIREHYCPRNKVVIIPSTQTLIEVLRLAYANKFSQFPVVDDEKFQGVVMENEIARWLGHQVTKGLTQVELSGVSVLQVMREKEPGREMIFEFRRLDEPEEDVMSLFQQRAALEVVLLTSSGGRDTRIEGIVTQWDAARYPSLKLISTATSEGEST